MTEKPSPILKPIQSQFCDAKVLLRRAASIPSDHVPMVIPTASDISVSKKSSAQVETSVLPQAVIPKSGELKLKGKRPSPLTLRVSENQKAVIRAKAKAAGITVNHFVLASALGSTYKPSNDPDLVQALLALNRELTAQGNNLNQIARQRNANVITAAQTDSMLDILGRSLLRTHKAVRNALVGDEQRPSS